MSIRESFCAAILSSLVRFVLLLTLLFRCFAIRIKVRDDCLVKRIVGPIIHDLCNLKQPHACTSSNYRN